MTTSIYAKSNGTQGALQVNGVDSLVFDITGLVSGYTNTLNKTLGYGQTWQAVIGSRVVGITYYNTTGKPIMVSAGSFTTIAVLGNLRSARVDGVDISYSSQVYATGTVAYGVLFLVPPEASYSVQNLIGSTPTDYWFELR